MTLVTALQALVAIKGAVIALAGVYASLRGKQLKSEAVLKQQIQSVENMALLTTTSLNTKLEAANSDIQSVASTMQGLLSGVHDIATNVQKSQSDIASIASSVDEKVAPLKSAVSL